MWEHRAPCRDATSAERVWFFGDPSEPPDPGVSRQLFQQAAEKFCNRCPVDVKTQCLIRGIELGDTVGMWGGFTASQRRRNVVPRISEVSVESVSLFYVSY